MASNGVATTDAQDRPAPLTKEGASLLLKSLREVSAKLAASQGIVSKSRAGLDFVTALPAITSFLQAALGEPRSTLLDIFGGDQRALLQSMRRLVTDTAFSSADAEATGRARTISDCLSACVSVEKVLDDLGAGFAYLRSNQDSKVPALDAACTELSPPRDARVWIPIVDDAQCCLDCDVSDTMNVSAMTATPEDNLTPVESPLTSMMSSPGESLEVSALPTSPTSCASPAHDEPPGPSMAPPFLSVAAHAMQPFLVMDPLHEAQDGESSQAPVDEGVVNIPPTHRRSTGHWEEKLTERVDRVWVSEEEKSAVPLPSQTPQKSTRLVHRAATMPISTSTICRPVPSRSFALPTQLLSSQGMASTKQQATIVHAKVCQRPITIAAGQSLGTPQQVVGHTLQRQCTLASASESCPAKLSVEPHASTRSTGRWEERRSVHKETRWVADDS